MTPYANKALEGPQLLSQILVKIKELTKSKSKCLVVFDLDSTLFDVSPRLQRIIQEFANLPENKKKFPKSIEVLKKVQTIRSDWGIKQALLRVGLETHSVEFHQAIKEFWLENFFSNHFVHYDVPFAGAADFASLVAQSGAEIVYLSGRVRDKMEMGTIEVLKKWNFPLDNNQSRLELKPKIGMDDAEFKKDWFLSLPEETHEQIWFFENEPLNVNLIQQHFKHIDIIFFDSTHAGKAEASPDLPRIFDFLLTDKT